MSIQLLHLLLTFTRLPWISPFETLSGIVRPPTAFGTSYSDWPSPYMESWIASRIFLLRIAMDPQFFRVISWDFDKMLLTVFFKDINCVYFTF